MTAFFLRKRKQLTKTFLLSKNYKNKYIITRKYPQTNNESVKFQNIQYFYTCTAR